MPSTVLGAYEYSQEQDKFSQHLLAGISVIKQDAMEVSIPFHHFLLLLYVNILLHLSLGHYRFLTLSYQSL